MIAFIGPIERLARENTDFRQVLCTGERAQLALMCLAPGEETGYQVHPDFDEFVRIEAGEAKFVLNESQEHTLRDGDAVVVRSGTYHNVINASKTAPLKLCTIYSPPARTDGPAFKTGAEVEPAEELEKKQGGLAFCVHVQY